MAVYHPEDAADGGGQVDKDLVGGFADSGFFGGDRCDFAAGAEFSGVAASWGRVSAD
jgi:hypothetical protein